ncbi:MAG TPA: N-acetyltransferase [Candidatus Omnitrophica bacterium]|nr:N-acetyltransferase [Candidatus Omnitrophota bacterium]
MIRKAKISDVLNIQNLINTNAEKGYLLPRSRSYLYENIRDFWVVEENNQIEGCIALHIVWEDLAEIKSLVVRQEKRGQGLGKKLVERAIQEAREYKIKKIFVLTYIPEYFLKFGFIPIDKSQLPHKIWSECINCPKFPNCQESAMLKILGE